MDTMQSVLSKVKHVGFVVEDLDASVRYFSQVFGIGPFKIIEPDVFKGPDYFEKIYRGRYEDFAFRFALAPLGNIEIEFIQPVKGKTVYDDFIKARGGGLHHVAFDVKDIDHVIKKLEKHGIRVVQSGKRAGMKWAYVEVDFMNGLILELMDRTA